MFFLFSVCFIAEKFDRHLFNSTNTSYNLPHIIFPYYNYQSEEFSIFNQFCNESSDSTDFVIALVNCDKSPTLCSKLKLKPGKVHISFPPHKNILQSKRPMTIDSIRQLSEDVKCQGYHELNTLEEVKSFSSRTPLFCLVARANAGDLEIKLPILRELSQNFIHHDIKFGLITEMSLYETFSHYPLTSFVYISPNLKFTSFRNDFTLQNLITFIYLHEQHPWDSPLPPITPSITYVGPTVDSNTRKHFLEYEAKYPFVHVNNINDPVLARSICQNTSSCFAVVDFNKFKSVRFEIDDNDEDQITNLMSQFEEEWKNIPILKRIKISAEISFALYSKVYYVVGMIIVIVVVAVIMFFMDMNREIEDTRIAKKEKKQKKH